MALMKSSLYNTFILSEIPSFLRFIEKHIGNLYGAFKKCVVIFCFLLHMHCFSLISFCDFILLTLLRENQQ